MIIAGHPICFRFCLSTSSTVHLDDKAERMILRPLEDMFQFCSNRRVRGICLAVRNDRGRNYRYARFCNITNTFPTTNCSCKASRGPTQESAPFGGKVLVGNQTRSPKSECYRRIAVILAMALFRSPQNQVKKFLRPLCKGHP